MMRRLAVLGVAVVVAAGASCGDDDDPAARGPSSTEASSVDPGSREVPSDRDGWIELFAAQYEAAGTPPDDAECMSQAFVDLVGVERLQSLAAEGEAEGAPFNGDLDVQFSEGEVDAWMDDLGGCMDVARLFAGGLSPGS